MSQTQYERFVANDPQETSFEMVDGTMFDPLNPDSKLMTIEIVATVLSNSCRFGGHVSSFYCTAQHSVLVAALAPDDLEVQRYAILHDADEAFGLPDMLTPVKKAFPAFREAQNKIGVEVEKAFDLDPALHDAVKIADRQALFLERMAVKHRSQIGRWREWLGNAEEPTGIEVVPLQPEDARALFIEAFDEVFEYGRPITMEWLSKRIGFVVDTENCLEPGY